MSRPILVSACLLGICSRYDGTSKNNAGVHDHLRKSGLIPVPVCPEQLAGLPTPRPRTFFRLGDGRAVLDGGGEVTTEEGTVVNEVFLRGARETLKIARLLDCRKALLKERSPSCGVHQIYRGDQKMIGQGVAAALLAREGLELYSEEDLP